MVYAFESDTRQPTGGRRRNQFELITGNYPLLVTATSLVNGVTTPRNVTVTVQVLATGITTFSGLVLDEEDQPVKGAIVKIGRVQVSTDDGGNFLTQNPPVGAKQVLFIDGGPASTPGKSLPIIPDKATIVAWQANVHESCEPNPQDS